MPADVHLVLKLMLKKFWIHFLLLEDMNIATPSLGVFILFINLLIFCLVTIKSGLK